MFTYGILSCFDIWYGVVHWWNSLYSKVEQYSENEKKERYRDMKNWLWEIWSTAWDEEAIPAVQNKFYFLLK